MGVIKNRNQQRLHRKRRIRSKIKGTAQRPRLVVFRSLKGVTTQVIDDTKGHTLVATSLKEIYSSPKVKNDVKTAGKVGELIAQKCLKANIKEVVFDRGGYKYHGKIKALADGARKAGLKF